MMPLNNDYEFTGVETVKVLLHPGRSAEGLHSSGCRTATARRRFISRETWQTMTAKKDRAFTFIIDKGDKLQSQMVMDSGTGPFRDRPTRSRDPRV
ncbi:MAG: hypothetical protein ACLR8L_00100 [Oscillospiraceae bacterium]